MPDGFKHVAVEDGDLQERVEALKVEHGIELVQFIEFFSADLDGLALCTDDHPIIMVAIDADMTPDDCVRRVLDAWDKTEHLTFMPSKKLVH